MKKIAPGAMTNVNSNQRILYTNQNIPQNLSEIRIRGSNDSRQIKGHRGSNLSEIQIKQNNGLAVSNF